MRTLLPEELQEQPLVKLAVGFAMIILAGFVVSGFLLYFQQMDLSPSSVATYFLGSEQDSLPARTYESMLSVTHAHTVMIGAMLLLLSLLLLRTPLSKTAKKMFIVLPFVSAIVDEASSWLVRYVDPNFAWLKIIAFLALQISLIGIILAILVGFFRPARRPFEPAMPERMQSRPPHQPQIHQHHRPEQGEPRRRRRRPRRRGPRGGQGGPPQQQGPPPTPSV